MISGDDSDTNDVDIDEDDCNRGDCDENYDMVHKSTGYRAMKRPFAAIFRFSEVGGNSNCAL